MEAVDFEFDFDFDFDFGGGGGGGAGDDDDDRGVKETATDGGGFFPEALFFNTAASLCEKVERYLK